MTQVWRINIKTASQPDIDPREFAIQNGYIGVGWAVDGECYDWETYMNLANGTYGKKGYKGWWPAINAVKNKMKVNDLCWTRDNKGVYYLGRIKSDWLYQNSKPFKEADLVNTRECQWIKIGTVDSIPGKIVNSFIPSRTVQRISDATILEFSKYLFNKNAEEFHYPLESAERDIYSLLSSDDCEDIVGIYLQYKFNYMFIPSTCKSDTMFYEYVLLHKETQKPATVQVKNGNVPLYIEKYRNENRDEVFLFTSKGPYIGEEQEYIHCLDPVEIREFIVSHRNLLPKKVQVWIDYLNEHTDPMALTFS
ncbi:hypothetical protein [Fredinandcohnia sp. 179-A 10B2 NHS]|uniref:hypothetical protein n=1 Tax=Fredinandcohnia sp. 179-A 10B2 NHS TaxID=3235176 RepID=UPI0039A0C59D